MTRKPIEKGKSLFQPVTTTVLPIAKVYARVYHRFIYQGKKSPVTTEDIIPLELRLLVLSLGNLRLVENIDIRRFHGNILI